MRHERVRVAVVSEPGKAGVKTHVVDLLRGLDLGRFDVTLYYSRRRSDDEYDRELGELAGRGIACVEIPMVESLRPLGDARALARLLAALRRQRPHILHLHSSKAGGLGRLASRLLRPRPRVIYTPHAMACYRSRLFLWLERGLGGLTDVPVAVSPSERADFITWRIPKAKAARVLTMGVRPPSSMASSSAASDRRPTEQFVVGACGRICYQKNARLFFALALQLGGGPYRFRWIGDFGDDHEAEQVRVMLEKAGWPPHIEITGWVGAPEEQLRALDAFCMLSRYESFGYVTAEAMALGVPVLAIASTGTVDLVRPEETGLLVEANVASLAAALHRLATDEPLRHRLTVNARRLIAQTHTVARMVDEVEQLYDELARGARELDTA